MEKKRSNRFGKRTQPAGARDDDPVRNFEKWKKKYSKTKSRVKRGRAPKKPEWQVERDYVATLVSRYPDINPDRVSRFSDFPISKKTLLGLQETRYRQPTEIQRQTIGFALQGKDVLGAAKTGSGKTLAFLIPVLECLYRQQWTSVDGLGALIIAPTRELAYQTFQVLRKVGKNHDFSAGLIIGGKDLQSEAEKIQHTNIIVCTPGRLLQHMDQTAAFHATSLHMLVLDEADRILDLGFADTVNAIVENLPDGRQTLLFSATQTKSVKDLARLSLREPQHVWVHQKARFSTPATLEQSYVVCELHQKVNVLYSFIRSHLKKKVIVFFACCKEVQYLFRVLCRLRPGTPVLALHGKQQQMKRVQVYTDFVGKQSAVLLATDLAARGLDFPAVNWVLQFDCPEDADTYVHRVGRTARYREGGEALLLLLPSEEPGMLSQLREKKAPINKIQINADKLQNVQPKLEAFLAQEAQQKERAQRCFVSYLRSVSLMKNKQVFDVSSLRIEPYALSLGLAVAPRVRFMRGRGRREQQPEDEDEKEEGLRDLKAQRTRHVPQDSGEDEKEDSGEEDDKDSRELLTVKRRDVFNLTGDQETLGTRRLGDPDKSPKRKTEKETRFKEAKKVLKRHFKMNTKLTFNEDGGAVQLWPPAQQSVTGEEEEEEEEGVSGINVEKAKARLRREDQTFDKQEFSRRVKAKHREKRLKVNAARREAGRRRGEDDDEDDEDEVVAYLASHSDQESEPSDLPDLDEGQAEEEEQEMRVAKRQHGGESDEGEELQERKRARGGGGRGGGLDPGMDLGLDGGLDPGLGGGLDPGLGGGLDTGLGGGLDTGLSLADDEEIALRLLGGQG
ncbi:LOW QUALITY PROTEIN: probable ATP-dependent RNA helicase DDX10 [Brachionichthys hirsutus]|uniref:LOW QUALITY PROTEIN: probable ATP-dependent RNA helicase DDX10 n=1 Tax=Brachionichthys hirsutus TaxID=412623 RepID=UPI003604F4BA